MPYFKENRGFKMKGFAPFTKKTDPPKNPTWMGTDEYRKPEDIPASEYIERGLNTDDYIPGYKAEKKDIQIPKKKETKKDRLNKALPLQEGEDKDTHVPKGNQKRSELIADIEDRIEFIGEDISNGNKTKKEAAPILAKLRKRLGFLRQNK